MHKYLPYHFFFLLLFTSASYSQISNKEVRAKIHMEEIEGNIKITGTAENLTDIVQSLSYKLSVIKKNKKSNNQSNNAQEGLFNLEPSETKNLSTTQVNLTKDDEVIVLLLFYDSDKKLVGKDRIVIGDEKKKDEAMIPVDGFELSGIISDDTKTKVGKDFYDFYYYVYNDKKINSKKIVTVSEELSFARNTKIIISIDNNVIYEFLARPDEEFLTLVADDSVNATYVYLKNLEKQSQYITQY
jgi:hypothetical protein